MDDFKNNFRCVQLQGFYDCPPRGPTCDVCGTVSHKSAAFHCGKCSVYYCDDCATKHNSNSLFRDHHVASLAQRVKSEPCVLHPGHQVGFLCRTCRPGGTLCAICMLSHPPTHDVVNIQDTANDLRTHLQDGLQTLDKKTDELSEHMRVIKRKCDQHDATLKSLQDDIKKHAETLVTEVENQAGEMLACAKSKMEQLKSEYNQGALALDLSNMETVKREIESALRGSDEACITSYEQLKEKIRYTTGAGTPNSAKISKDIEVKFVAGTMIKNFGTLKCGGGQKAVKCGKEEGKPKTPKRKTNSDIEGRSPPDTPPLKVGRTKEEARRGEKLPMTLCTMVARKPYKDLHPKKAQQLPTMAARKPYKDLHPKKAQPSIVPMAGLYIPPPCEEPQRMRICDLTAQHVFWDIKQQEQAGLTYITEICAVSTTSGWSMLINHFTPIKQALLELIKFLGAQPVVLVGYDIPGKCESLLEAIKDSHLEKKFEKASAGFLDTLQLLKTKFKEVDSPTVEKMHMHCFGKTYGGDLQAGVEALQRLVLQTCPDRQERLSYSFKAAFIRDLKQYHEQRKNNMATWKPLMDDKVISRHIAEKAAASGLTLRHVKTVYDQQGLEGVRTVLAKVTDGKARVTNRQEIINDMGAYLATMPATGWF